MKVMANNDAEALALVKRMVFLAYQACGGTSGLGFLQAVDGADENRVWAAAYRETDYPGAKRTADNEVYGDYVLGRMMKWGCKWNGSTVEIWDFLFDPGYQGFSRKYPNNMSLVAAAAESLGIDVRIEP